MQCLLVNIGPVHDRYRNPTGLHFSVALVVKFLVQCGDSAHLQVPGFGGGREVSTCHGHRLD